MKKVKSNNTLLVKRGRLIAFLFCVLSFQSLLSQTYFEENKITKYSIRLILEEPSDLSFLDSVIEPYSIFGFAEYHWTGTVTLLNKKMITYLATKKKLSKIVLERPYAYGVLVTEYLKTGDTSLLKKVTDLYWGFDSMELGNKQYVDSYNLFKWLYGYSKTTGIDLEIVGCDFNHIGRNGKLSLIECWFLLKLITDNKASKTLPLTYHFLKEVNKDTGIGLKSLRKLRKIVTKELLGKTDDLKDKLKSDFKVFQNLLQDLEYISENGRSLKDRERVMYEIFIREVKPSDVVYAQYGHGHIVQSTGKRFHFLKGGSFFSHLQNDANFKNKIFSCYLIWNNYDSPSGYGNHNGIYYDDEYEKLFSEINEPELMLDFRNAINSYSDLKEYFQFSIFLKNPSKEKVMYNGIY